jgi:5-formyltetrahydrofolate cyclo-ligase
MNTLTAKVQLRKQLRATRRGLTAKQQALAAERLLTVLRPLLGHHKKQRIGLYTAMDGEIDLTPLVAACRRWRIELYLPVLHRFKNSLLFARYDVDSPMQANKYGIPEPYQTALVKPWQLNLVLLPLVGFDPQGGRLGMGGGYYDRTFAGAARWPKRPAMLGVAHECQKVARIPLEPWDIQLDGIISDARVYRTRPIQAN